MHSLRPRLSSVVAVAAAMDGCGSPAGKRRIMVVADPGRESAAALEWALYHAVLEHDDIILLHVEPVSARRASALSSFLSRPPSGVSQVLSLEAAVVGAGEGGGDYEFLDAMRARCQAVQPTVRVQIERVEMESKDKAAAILTQTQLSRADLLVIGQRRNATSFLGCKLSGSMSNKGPDTAEFLIENSKCLCVGVQKKGQNAGYLLNTKTHKNFWLLA
ncbi:universal stress protein domain containing protein [Musa troglodytarum]|uniref:Universal stress protein domain containing protein n=1 Tax=Musa troglodytarum TaxID=320322 RepID=A0A9E7JIY7_9LILI|nr:universal stress protein domain containing protein [Musa troglodytarum]URD83649.1 universal stress protein domain containing protein [Musa troglodytarum]